MRPIRALVNLSPTPSVFSLSNISSGGRMPDCPLSRLSSPSERTHTRASQWDPWNPACAQPRIATALTLEVPLTLC
ncbi:hypothetical protein K443DRAFT_522140 [Laccaria amethystina LaAM-08-1]|uniref:Uncharacterized protein n=1 Tax=Laccaria amethystina LaAM-08-1 TaxID=1095629 RepID=A0A0C9WLZ6_9AGAR|nr:hypothetical protein K443DRAFT_522140 [Laccaria amethystina LaAM-08-1]